MKAVFVALKRIIGSLVICGSLGAAVAQPLVGHAAGLTPRISATVVGETIIQVAGYGFGPGDRVEVVDATGNRILNRVFTTVTLPLGRIAVTMPPHIVRCVFQVVTVRAIDLNRHRHSNSVSVVLGIGLCE